MLRFVLYWYVLGVVFFFASSYTLLTSSRVWHRSASSNSKLFSNFEEWKCSTCDFNDLERWWKENDSLLTIGAAGVTSAHLNSLSNLIQQHKLVKVKLASDKIDVNTIAQAIVSSEELNSKVKLLEVRRKGFMLGRQS